MNKERPKVFAAKIDKSLNNNNSFYITRSAEEIKEEKKTFEKSVNQKIREIFGSSRYVYKADVVITLKDRTITKKIIGRNKFQIITIDNELINIEDILDIDFVK